MTDAIADKLYQMYKDKWEETTFLWKLFGERSNLYGALIMLMLDNDVWEFKYDDVDSEWSHKYILSMKPDEEVKSLIFKLEKRDDV